MNKQPAWNPGQRGVWIGVLAMLLAACGQGQNNAASSGPAGPLEHAWA